MGLAGSPGCQPSCPSQTPLLARLAEQKHWPLYGRNLSGRAGGWGGLDPVAPSQARGDFRVTPSVCLARSRHLPSPERATCPPRPLRTCPGRPAPPPPACPAPCPQADTAGSGRAREVADGKASADCSLPGGSAQDAPCTALPTPAARRCPGPCPAVPGEWMSLRRPQTQPAVMSWPGLQNMGCWLISVPISDLKLRPRFKNSHRHSPKVFTV